MLNKVSLKNFGCISNLEWSNLAKINLIIGNNATGKTFFLKLLYTVIRTLEEYKRGDDNRSEEEILMEKLYWTFQTDKIGDLVTKNAVENLNCDLIVNQKEFSFNFGKETSRHISKLNNQILNLNSNSIFLPAKEILSLHHIILKSREQDKMFGFDDTYLDLARALRLAPQKGNNYKAFSKARKSLENILGGKIEYDEQSHRWQFKKGNQKFSIGVTAEGIKKIAILDTLLGNHYLTTNSIIFIDEPESALHPSAISQLLEIIALLAEAGIQFFMASHSYFVIKKLFLIAQEKEISVPLLSAVGETWSITDLREGMPNNSIIDESIRLYEQEVEQAFK